MSFQNRDINLAVKLPVITCTSCDQKIVLMAVLDCAEIDVDNLTYPQTAFTYCPFCGEKAK